MLSHGNLPHLEHELHEGHLLSAFSSDCHAKNEEDDDDSSEDEDDPGHGSGANHSVRQTLGALADSMEDALDEPLTEDRLVDGTHTANNPLARQLYVQDNSNSSNSMVNIRFFFNACE